MIKKTLNARQARWIAFLSKYVFIFRHIKGKENIVVDALSKKQHELHTVLISGYELEFKNMLKTISSNDSEYNKLMEKYTNMLDYTEDSAYHIDVEGFVDLKK